MVKEIRIYVEGGGDNRSGKALLREGLGNFLRSLRDKARQQQIGWTVVACGNGSSALEDFRLALETHRGATNILLVDAEAAVTGGSLATLRSRGGWEVAGLDEHQVHLMVQAMEAWLIADVDTLAEFYGQGFQKNAIPPAQDVESVSKQRIEDALKRATHQTQKGKYHKIQHGARLIGLVRPESVRQRARHCDRLFKTVEELLDG